MLEYIQESSIFYIVPDNIEHAGVFSFEKNTKDTMSLISEDELKISKGDFSEVFFNSNEGIIYFNTLIKEVINNTIIIDIPKDYEILQRRENKRLKINSPITIKKDEKETTVILYDISAGGIKILTENQLLLDTSYEVYLNFDNLNVSFNFLPKRISVGEKGKGFQISGQIISKSPKDKISLVQYCYKKIFEQSNR